MNVFLAGIIQGSKAAEEIHAQNWREPIKAAIARYLPDAEVYCHFNEHPNSLSYNGSKIRKTFDDGVARATAADLVVAYLPSASMGTAIEIYEAYRAGAVVLTVTPMAANWVVRLYSHKIFKTVEALEAFLADGGLEKLQKESTPNA